MKRSSFSSLHARLLMLVCLALAPALGLIIYTSYNERRIETRKIEADTFHSVKLLSGLMEQKVEGVRQLLITLFYNQSILQRDASSCNKLLPKLQKHFPEYLTIGAADPEGNIFCFGIPMTEPINIADRAYFRNTMQNQGIGIGNYAIGRITGRHSLHIGYAARDEAGKIQTVIFVPFDLDEFSKLFGKIKVSPEAALIMIDRNGTLTHDPWHLALLLDASLKMQGDKLKKLVLRQPVQEGGFRY